MSATPTLREARPADLASLAELFDLYRQFYERAPDRAAALAFIGERLQRRDSQLLVAEAGGRLLGFCQLYPLFCSLEARPIYSLYDLFVAPAARQQGVGRALLLAAEATARAQGKVRMDLTTAKTNHAAQSLYESLGWVRDEVFLTYTRRVAG